MNTLVQSSISSPVRFKPWYKKNSHYVTDIETPERTYLATFHPGVSLPLIGEPASLRINSGNERLFIVEFPVGSRGSEIKPTISTDNPGIFTGLYTYLANLGELPANHQARLNELLDATFPLMMAQPSAEVIKKN